MRALPLAAALLLAAGSAQACPGPAPMARTITGRLRAQANPAQHNGSDPVLFFLRPLRPFGMRDAGQAGCPLIRDLSLDVAPELVAGHLGQIVRLTGTVYRAAGPTPGMVVTTLR